MKNGHGEYTWCDGTVYTGMWRDGKRHGKGTKRKGNRVENKMYRYGKSI